MGKTRISRYEFWKPIFKGWWLIVAIILWAWGLFGNIRGEFISAENQDKWRLPALFPQIRWYWLAIVFLLVTIAAILEGTYRLHRRKVNELDAEHNTDLLKLKRKSIRRRKRIQRKFMAARATLGQYAEDLTDANVAKGRSEDELLLLREKFNQIEGDRESLKFQLEALKKLKLVVHTNRLSEIRMERCADELSKRESYFINIFLRIHLENHALVNTPITKLEAYLIRETKSGREKEIWNTKTPVTAMMPVNEVVGGDILAGRMTEEDWFQGVLHFPIRYVERLNAACFLRVTMEAMRQPPYSVDLDVDWGVARTKGQAFLTPRK